MAKKVVKTAAAKTAATKAQTSKTTTTKKVVAKKPAAKKPTVKKVADAKPKVATKTVAKKPQARKKPELQQIQQEESTTESKKKAGFFNRKKDQNESAIDSNPKKGFFKKVVSFLRTTHRGYLLSFLLAALALFLFVFYQYKVSSQRAKFMSDLHSLSEKNKKMMEEQNKNFLHQIATPFTWAVRSEMLRKNFEIVDQYMIKLVQKQNFQSVYIVDKSGKVLLASDKKNQGKNFSDFMPSEYLSYSNVVVKKITDTKYYCSSPILGFENRIGTVFFEYTPKIIDLDKLYESIEKNDGNELETNEKNKNPDLEEPEKELPEYSEEPVDEIK